MFNVLICSSEDNRFYSNMLLWYVILNVNVSNAYTMNLDWLQYEISQHFLI